MTKTNRKKRVKMIIYIVFVIVAFILIFWNQPVYKNYTITTNKIQNGFKIVHLSDLHSTTYGKNQKRLIKKIDQAKPDLVLLTGDIVDDINDEEDAYILMRGLVTKYPLYYVDGNHEVWHEDTEQIYKDISHIGVHILKNTSENIKVNGEDITLAGIMDPSIRGEKAAEANVISKLELTGLKTINSEFFTILLTHRPEFFDLYEDYSIDLALAGHAHGGQMRIPFLLNGIYAPDQGLKPQHAGGYYKLNTYELIVSRGLSLNLYLPRIFNPPEVVVIQVNGGLNDN